jgi:AcrR family transcriptional regulator
MTDQSVCRKEQIMNEAKKLFASKGYHDVRVDDVARACGVAKGTLYLYFKSKADLFIQVFIEELNNIIGKVMEIINSGRKLEDVLSEIFDYFQNKIRKDEYFRRFGEMHRGNSGFLSKELVGRVKKAIFSKIRSVESEMVSYLKKNLNDTELNLHDLYDILVSISVEISRSKSNTIKKTALSVILNGIKKEEN